MTAKRVDDNQREIVNFFRRAGCSVLILSAVGKGCPDAIVGLQLPNGARRNFLIEIKNGNRPPSGQLLTEMEQHFFDTWKGQVMIINSIEKAQNFMAQLLKET